MIFFVYSPRLISFSRFILLLNFIPYLNHFEVRVELFIRGYFSRFKAGINTEKFESFPEVRHIHPLSVCDE